MSALTLFPDYVLPAVLRSAGVLEYDPPFADRIDAGRVVPEGSLAEVGIRAATVIAGDQLLAVINDHRDSPVTAVELDQYLWRRGRADTGRVHRTPTTSY